MSARINPANPAHFDPVNFNARGLPRQMTGRKRKIPREVRLHLYQLDLTLRETQAELSRILVAHGVKTKASAAWIMRRIRRERG